MKTLVQLSIGLFWFLTVSGCLANGQPDTPVMAGKVRKLERAPSALLVTAEHARAEIISYSPTILRFRVTREPAQEDFSHAVIRQPGQFLRDLREYPDSAILYTDSLRVIIYLDLMRFKVMDTRGNVLSEELPGMPVTWLGTEVTCYRKLFTDEKFLGLGEKTGNLDKRGGAYENWNSDVPAYAVNHDPLYQSIPFFTGIHGRSVYGVFLDNTYRTRFNFGASTDERFSFFSAANGEMNYYFFGAQSIPGILSDYTWLTGRMPMPPLWSLGYHQCRWSYFPESQVLAIAQQFRDREIPCDAVWLDIDYMDGYKIFTWNRDRFPMPATMTGLLGALGFRTVTIVDPGIRIEKGYFAYDEGIANGYFATYPDGTPYTGSVWPGRCHFPDFTSEKVRKWWGSSFRSLTEAGVAGFWNDMNEPSAWGQDIPGIVQFDFEGRKGTMARAHNIYGLEMCRATYEGTRALLKGKRPFTLTRAGYAGIQRYSAVWTGDNEATDEHMLLSARMITGMGLSGVAFTGADVGGFMGEPSEALYTRWMSLGAFTPFFRGHSAWDTRSKEPWSFGANVEKQVKAFIVQRYKLLPYIYSAFYESHSTGLPVARSLAVSNPFDEKVYWWKYQNQFLFGDNLLVAPVSCTQQAGKVYLPEGGWYRFSTDEFYKGPAEVLVDAPLNDLPVFARASGIIPMQSPVQHTGQRPSPVLELHLYNGDQESSFLYYEDDGISDRAESGVFYRRQIRFKPAEKTFSLEPAEGSHPSVFTSVRLVLHGFRDLTDLKVNEMPVSLKKKSSWQWTAEFPLPTGKVLVEY